MEIVPSINVFGKELITCCDNPKTGFFRNGLCDTCKEDFGVHTVCILATEEFLTFSKAVGNDLSTPHPDFEFSGVKPGDRWCLCALRWKEAYKIGSAPFVILEATHEKALDYIELSALLEMRYIENLN